MTDFEERERTTIIDVPLLRKAVEWVEAEAQKEWRDREWIQGSWFMVRESDTGFCGTACCVAGWVAMQDESVTMEVGPYGEPTDRVTTSGGHTMHVAEYARDRLGLEEWEADVLFSGANDAEDIRHLAEQFVGDEL